MLLKTWLGRTKAETVKIACEDGSSFLYCGKPCPTKIITRMFENIAEILNEVTAHSGECDEKVKWKDSKVKEVHKDLNERITELVRFKEALSREVVDEYPSTAVPNQKIVIIGGYWNCKYWDIEEFDKRWKKERNKT